MFVRHRPRIVTNGSHLRRDLWPDCPDEEHHSDIRLFLDQKNGSSPSSCGFSTGDMAVFVADRAGGGLSGFLEASIRPYAEGVAPQRVGYIEGWYVDLDVRRSGIGRALVEAAELWARSMGCHQMASDAHCDNTESINAHARLGYQDVGRLVHFAKDLG